ncbi:ESX secretion-associated protein EspG [Mycolicibacterium thermoresistibile]
MTDTSIPTAVPMDLVGTVAVVDLEAACALYGRDVLPYPLGRSRPVGSLWLLTRDVEPIDDRLHTGDLRDLRELVEALVRPEVCVECRVRHRDEDTADLRLHAVQAEDAAFIAVQRPDRDVIDAVTVYSVMPESLGAVIADAVGLVGPGGHHRIAVSGSGDELPVPAESFDDYDEFGFPVAHNRHDEPAVQTVGEREVVASGTVQSRYEPAGEWGVDSGRRILQWVQICDDGDYLYAPSDAGYAEPLDAVTLRDCINGFIADDLVMLRAQRDL